MPHYKAEVVGMTHYPEDSDTYPSSSKSDALIAVTPRFTPHPGFEDLALRGLVRSTGNRSTLPAATASRGLTPRNPASTYSLTATHSIPDGAEQSEEVTYLIATYRAHTTSSHKPSHESRAHGLHIVAAHIAQALNDPAALFNKPE